MYRFKHLAYAEGLTNSNVYAFSQDNQGFMWVGTEGGLFRYDGFRFKEYKSNIGDTNSINSNVIFSLLYDSKDNLWIGTYKGLLLYNQKLDNFIDLKISDLYIQGFASTVNQIIEIPNVGVLVASANGGIFIDQNTHTINQKFTSKLNAAIGSQELLTCHYSVDGVLWIGTQEGVYAWQMEEEFASHYRLSSISGILESDIVLKIFEDSYGDLWASTRGGGVFRKRKGGKSFDAYLNDKTNAKSIGSNECFDFWESEQKQLWISTNGSGINFFNRKTETFSRLSSRPGDKFGVINNNTRTIFEDNQGDLWISSFQGGINILTNTPYQFEFQGFDVGSGVGFESTSVISINLDNKNILWVGTDGGGLKRINRKTKEIITFQPLSDKAHIFPDKVVTSIYRDFRGKLWMGTYLEGLIEFDPNTYAYNQYKYKPGDKNSISNNYVTAVLEDTRGNLWVATNGGGLNLFDQKQNNFIRFQKDLEKPEQTLSSDYISVIEEDYNGDLWIGTYWGLSKFSIRNFTFNNYQVEKDYKNSISSNIIYSLLSDSKNRLWVGTRTGLAQYDFRSNSFYNYSDVEGISSNQINGILEDDKGILWISTDNGIVQFNPETRQAYRYSEEDGLQGNEFYHNSCYRGYNEELFFGGYKGFNSFFADSIKKRYFEPKVILTNLSILDEEIPIGIANNGRVILEKNITLTQKIELKYSDKSITLGFSAVDFIEGNKNIYAYKLENFDADWNRTNSSFPFATYTNLSPGEYTLRVKAGKQEFIEQIEKETQIVIIIKPPIWRTWWAYSTYVLFVLSVVFYFWRLSLQRLKEKNEIKLEKVKREQTEAISQARMRFFTNISHEIRTPLTLIIGPLEQLIQKGKETQPYRRQFDIMLKNARRLLRLINQLLDLRKIELEKTALRAEYSDISKFVKDIVFSFEEYALDKKIDFQFKSTPESIKVWFDPDKMDKVVFNLLSNAFKYTPERGKISMNIKANVQQENKPYKYVELHVSDTGKGIKQKDIQRIFDRFYQGDLKGNDSQPGWGLGLSLTDSFVKLHKGNIQVESAESVGTHFRVYFPMGDEHLTDDEKISDTNEPGLNKYIHLSTAPYIDSPNRSAQENDVSKKNKYQLLIVEDNKDLRDYLMSELDEYYNCFDTADGKAGIEMAIDIMPDLIISDIMMPEMNGIELCHSIKENIITSHIPVVLLTAKSNVIDQIAGFESGADAYIPKPFNIENLIANLNSILLNRQKLKEKAGVFSKTPGENKIHTADDKFVSLVDEKVNTHLSDTQFGVEELANILGMSRAHLHRKMKAIVNVGPNDYIRKVRLRKAAELLLQGNMTISEVSTEVGFSSTSYFSSTFKSYFNMSPKTFVDKKRS